jgi:hypothetical protein
MHTVSNGGIIVSKNAVLAIEGFSRPAGAVARGQGAQLGSMADARGARRYHADHANGVAGTLENDHPVVRATFGAREVVERNNPKTHRAPPQFAIRLITAAEPSALDSAGGRCGSCRASATRKVTSRWNSTSLRSFLLAVVLERHVSNFVDAIQPLAVVQALRLARHAVCAGARPIIMRQSTTKQWRC